MSASLYQITVPLYINGLEALQRIITKGEAYATEKQIDTTGLLKSKLSPDMYDFIQQVGYAYFMALEVVGNLATEALPDVNYKERTTPELAQSLDRVIAYLKKIKPAQIDGQETALIPLFWEKEKSLPALEYIQKIGLPNFYFHVITAYDIFRNQGVPLGKNDYILEM
jgi:hypothetical protein